MALVTDDPWQAIASAALVGTDRQPFQVPPTASRLGQCLSHLQGRSAESALLSAAGIVALHQQVGWLPDMRSSPPTDPCSPDDQPRCSPVASRCLQHMLQGQYPQLLPEWLEKAAIAQQRVPELLLPGLLDKGRQQRDLRAAIVAVLGQRGQWLAAQNPDWHYAVSVTTETDWEIGTSAARLLYLQELRSHNPDRARELLQATWTQENASDRAQFLETFQTGLSDNDEPFLDQALSDRRSKEVRRVAADLLARLPESRLCQHMTALIQPYITLAPGSPPTLVVQLPDALTPELTQLGIEPKPPLHPWLNLGEKAGWLLQLIGATPLSFWNDAWKLTASEILSLTDQHEWRTMLLQGWALAAQRQQEQTWAIALLQNVIHNHQSEHSSVFNYAQTQTLLSLLSPEAQNTTLLELLRSRPDLIHQPWMIHLLSHSPCQWSVALAQEVLSSLSEYMAHHTVITQSSWELRSGLKNFAYFMPVSMLPDVLQLQAQLPPDSIWLNSVSELASLLQFRQEIAQAFRDDGG